MNDESTVLLLLVALIGGAIIYFIFRQRKARERASQADAAVDYLQSLLRTGTPIKLSFGAAPIIALKQFEETLCVFPETTLIEPRAVRNWRSNYGGPSFRVAKGVSFRLGASAGASESHDELRAIDAGTLMLTNLRLIFVGSKRTTSIPLEKIINLDTEGFSDSLRINREGKQKAEVFQLNTSLKMSFQHNGEQHSVPLLSPMVQIAIGQAIEYRKHPELIGVALPSDAA